MVAAVAIALAAGPSVHKLFEVSLPENYPMSDTVVDAATMNVAWRAVDSNGKPQVYLLLLSKRKILSLSPGGVSRSQNDCGAGLLSVEVGDGRQQARRTLVFRMKDGSKVSEVRGHRRRVGKLFHDVAISDLNGKVLFVPGEPEYGKPNPTYMGRLIWDGNRRLAIIGVGDMPNDNKDVVEIRPNWTKGKRVNLSGFAFGFEKLVGNPDEGPFAVFESSNRSTFTTGIFTKDLRRIGPGPREALSVTDVGPNGILALNLKYVEGANDYVDNGAVCLDAKTGKLKWRGKYAGTWLGRHVLAGLTIADGRTGRRRGTLKLAKPGGIVAKSGDLLFVQTPKMELVVYRVRP